MRFDMPLEQLVDYRPQVELPSDFDEFWHGEMESAEAVPLDAKFRPVVSPFPLIEINEISFVGYGGAEIKGWLLLPDRASDPDRGSWSSEDMAKVGAVRWSTFCGSPPGIRPL